MNLAAVITRYARRFAAVHRVGHSVSSPLGAWLMLAMAAQAAPEGALRDELEDLLGLDVLAAASALDHLLHHPSEVVNAALAAWGFIGDDWVRHLPTPVETGPVPTQPQAEAWAREHTLGLIQQFPVDHIAALDGLVASALATRVSWMQPYELTDARALHSPWSTRVTQALEGERGEFGGYLADTADAGIVGGDTGVGIPPHFPDAGQLWVTSVIAEAAVDPVDVLAAAHDIAAAEAARAPVARRSLSDMALGDGAFWTITEERVLGGGEHGRAILPAWRAQSDHDLMSEPELGFGVVRRALLSAGAGSSARPVDVCQTAVAGFGQYGFEAAALGGIAIGGDFGRQELARVVTLRFGHPYAVVAVARGSERLGDPWIGMPVFTAWVTEPGDPSEVTTGS